MRTLLLILLILDSVILIGAILLQAGKGGGLAASFGGAGSSADQLFGTRQAGNLLTRTSWWGGAAFLFLAFVLSLMVARAPSSILERGLGSQPLPPVSQPVAPVESGAPGLNLEPVPPPAPTPTPPPQP